MYLRYDWPLHFVLWVTNWLPDNVIFLHFRGWLARPFLGRCGKGLRLARNIAIHNPRNVRLGQHVFFAYGCLLLATDIIEIDDEVMFGPYVVASAGNHTRIKGSFRYGPPSLAPIRIGRGGWVGAHATLTAGSVVGAGSLVAAGAVVTGPVPADVIVGGVPARIIKQLEDDPA